MIFWFMENVQTYNFTKQKKASRRPFMNFSVFVDLLGSFFLYINCLNNAFDLLAVSDAIRIFLPWYMYLVQPI